MRSWRWMVAAGLLAAGLPAVAQFTGGAGRAAARAEAVEYLYPEQIAVLAGKTATVALHFRVAPGLHINSHTPRDPELIPTTLSFPEEAGLKLLGVAYPAGSSFAFAIDPGHALSVYTGEFVLTARLTLAPGERMAQGRLRYQACTDRACLPPRMIPVAINVIGR